MVLTAVALGAMAINTITSPSFRSTPSQISGPGEKPSPHRQAESGWCMGLVHGQTEHTKLDPPHSPGPDMPVQPHTLALKPQAGLDLVYSSVALHHLRSGMQAPPSAWGSHCRLRKRLGSLAAPTQILTQGNKLFFSS